METKVNTHNNGQGFAIAGLVIGILALLISFIPCIGITAILIGILAVVFSAVAFSMARKSDSQKGMALAALIVSSLAVIIGFVWIVFFAGMPGMVKNKLLHINEWSDKLEQMDDDDWQDTESLQNLEIALDSLEGVVDDVNNQAVKSIDSVHKEVKKTIDKAKKEINRIKDTTKMEKNE